METMATMADIWSAYFNQNKVVKFSVEIDGETCFSKLGKHPHKVVFDLVSPNKGKIAQIGQDRYIFFENVRDSSGHKSYRFVGNDFPVTLL